MEEIVIGDRVGVLAGAMDDGAIVLLGYGKYVGDFIPGPEAIGSLADEIRFMEETNPKIVLDNGEVVWGCECWWGSAERIHNVVTQHILDGGKVKEGKMSEIRKKFKEGK